MRFASFDPAADYRVVWRHLPHWEQSGAAYFITWRTHDSLPREVVELWIAQRTDWLARHGLLQSKQSDHGVTGPQVPRHLLGEYRRFVAERWESRLDECHGACVFRQPALAQIVADSLLHFDGVRYAMGDFVVMPNHVHLLVAFPDDDRLLRQCRSWKKYTATEINKRLGRRGEFWQDESFDHVVRSSEEFDGYRTYIAENPVKAKLVAGSYVHYRAADPV